MNKTIRWLTIILLFGILYYLASRSASGQEAIPYIKANPTVINLLQAVPDVHFSYNHQLISSHQDTGGFINFLLRQLIYIILYGLLGLSLLHALNTLRRKINLTHELMFAGLAAALTTAIAWQIENIQNNIAAGAGCSEDIIVAFCAFLLFYICFYHRKNEDLRVKKYHRHMAGDL